jgi:hypothetical protein
MPFSGGLEEYVGGYPPPTLDLLVQLLSLLPNARIG